MLLIFLFFLNNLILLRFTGVSNAFILRNGDLVTSKKTNNCIYRVIYLSQVNSSTVVELMAFFFLFTSWRFCELQNNLVLLFMKYLSLSSVFFSFSRVIRLFI